MLIYDTVSYRRVITFVNVPVGGSEWVQEDTIELKNIYIPDPKAEIDLSCILGGERKISHVLSSENFFKVGMKRFMVKIIFFR